jgi:hypothetical protein
MGILGKNRLGSTEEEPKSGFGIVASEDDVAAWAEIHRDIHDRVRSLLRAYKVTLPSSWAANSWAEREETQAYTDLSDKGKTLWSGFETILDFGPIDALDFSNLIEETNASSRAGKRFEEDLKSEYEDFQLKAEARKLQAEADAARRDGGGSVEAQAAADEARILVEEAAIDRAKSKLPASDEGSPSKGLIVAAAAAAVGAAGFVISRIWKGDR